MKDLLLAIVAATTLLLGACGDTTISLTDYDTSCNLDDDCFVIQVGDVCDCACNAGAINKKDQGKYLSDRGSPPCSRQCGACAPVEAYCDAGTCAVRTPPLP